MTTKTPLCALAGLIAAGLFVAVGATEAQASRPNIILINADDLGYGDLGCYGATKLRTPNIDRLAREGRRFTDAHSASAVCSPSRYGLLTGRYPLRKNFWGPIPFTSELTIDPSRPTLASVLRSAGYATAVIGKWHLGFGKGKCDWNKALKPGPLELGFDTYFGMPTVNSGPPWVYVENHGVVEYDPADPFVHGKKPATQAWPEKGMGDFGGAEKARLRYRDEYVGTTFAEKAVAWIREHHAQNKKRPFFLYLATTNIHHPFTPHPRFKGTSQCGLYGDFVHELDWMVGEVLNTLDELDLADNTLVVFTSDNGGMLNNTGQKAWRAGHRLNGKLLGFKFGAWEGGHRVPLIVRWPGEVPPGTESDALVSQIDLITTFAEAAGGSIPEGAVVDGVSQLAEFTGTAAGPARDLLVISPNSPKHLAIRRGKWVYIPARDEGGFQQNNIGDHCFGGAAVHKLTKQVNSDIRDGRIRTDAPPAQLYDLESDPCQARNVHNEYPEVVARLSAALKTWREDIPESPRLGWINLKQDRQAPTAKSATKGAASRVAATKSARSVVFDFESGRLEPWKIVEGTFARIVGNRVTFFHSKGEYNKQGEYYLTTLETAAKAEKGSDPQTGVIVSPLFIPGKGSMTFRVGGGNGVQTYVALCTADGKEVQRVRGVNSQVMQKASWDLTPYVGRKMFIKIFDGATGSWGHITADNFQFDGELLTRYPERLGEDGAKKSTRATRDGRLVFSGTPRWTIRGEHASLRVEALSFLDRPQAGAVGLLLQPGSPPGELLQVGGERFSLRVRLGPLEGAKTVHFDDRQGAVVTVDPGTLETKSPNALWVSWHSGRYVTVFVNGRMIEFTPFTVPMPDAQPGVTAPAQAAARILELHVAAHLPAFAERYRIHRAWREKHGGTYVPTPVLQHYNTIIKQPGGSVRDPSEVLLIDGRYWVYFTYVSDPVKDGFIGSIWCASCAATDDPANPNCWSKPVEVIKRGDPTKDHDGTGCFTPDCYYDGKRVFVFYTGINSTHAKGHPQRPPRLEPEHIMVAVSKRPDGGFVKTKTHTPLTPETRGLGYDEATVPGGNLLLRGKAPYDMSLIDHGQWWTMPDGERRYYYKGGGGETPGGGAVCLVRHLDENWLNGRRHSHVPILHDPERHHFEGILITQVDDALFLQLMIFDGRRLWETWTSDATDGIHWKKIGNGFLPKRGHLYNSMGVDRPVEPFWGVGQFLTDGDRRVALGYLMVL